MDMPVLLIGSTPDVDVTKVKTLQSQKFGDKTRGANVVPDHTKFVEQQDEETKGNIVLDGIWGNQRGGSPEITEASKGLSKAMKATLRIAKSAKQSLTDWLDVEARFKRKGHHKTGLAVKNFFGRKTARQIQGVQKAREFMDVIRTALGTQPTAVQLERVLLAYENDNYFRDELTATERQQFTPAIQYLDKFFTDARNEINSRLDEHMQVDFQKKAMKKAIDNLRALEKKALEIEGRPLPTTDTQQTPADAFEEVMEQIKKAEARLLDVAQLHYANIPIAAMGLTKKPKGMQDSDYQKLRKSLKKAFSTNISKERRAVSMWNMKKSKRFKHLMFNPVEVIINYENRNAQDYALLDLRDAMIEDGLIWKQDKKLSKIKKKKVDKNGKTKPKGFEGMSSDADILAGSYAHPDAKEMINNLMSVQSSQTVWEKVVGYTKMLSFFNPIFLPTYDIFQSITGGAFFSMHMPTHMKTAWTSVMKQDENYKQAMRDGLFSKPFDLPFGDLRHMMRSVEKANGTGVLRSLSEEWKEMGLTAKDTTVFMKPAYEGNVAKKNIARGVDKALGPISAIYKASWDLAWKMDEFIRMISYETLKTKKGMSSVDAAQTAAKMHGDYASVPRSTRRFLNKIFFTPTFKIVMAKLYGGAIAEGVAVPYRVVRGRTSTRKQKQLAIAAMGIMAVNAAFDGIMRANGWEPEDDAWYNYGRRYEKKIRDKHGRPKTEVLTWSSTFNMIQRYAQKVSKVKEVAALPKGVYDVLKNDLHPMYGTVISMIQNKRWDGSPIYNENDSQLEKVGRMTLFTVTNMLAAVDVFTEASGIGDPEMQSMSSIEAEKQIAQMNAFARLMLGKYIGLASLHVRDRKQMRTIKELKGLMSRSGRDQKQYYLRHGKMNSQWLKSMEGKLKKLVKKTKKK